MEQKTIAVDFDGTLNHFTEWGDGTIINNPIPGAVEAMQALHRQAHKIVLFTCRTNPQINSPDDIPRQLSMLREWLNNNGLHFMEISLNAGKPMADYYIDDRGISFTNNWPDIVAFLSKKESKEGRVNE